MSMDAIALVRVPFEKVKEALGETRAPEGAEAPPEATWVRGASGPVAIAPLDDATLLFTGVSVREAEPDQLAGLVRAMLGDLADAHDDERGLLVFPARALPETSTYDAVVDEAADFGDWVTLPEETPELAGGGMPAGLEAMMGQVMGAMGGDPSQVGGLWEQAQKMMTDPAMQAQLMSAAQQMMTQLQTGEGGMDFSKMAAQAQEMLQQDPALVEQLAEKLGDEAGGEAAEPEAPDPSNDDDDQGSKG